MNWGGSQLPCSMLIWKHDHQVVFNAQQEVCSHAGLSESNGYWVSPLQWVVTKAIAKSPQSLLSNCHCTSQYWMVIALLGDYFVWETGANTCPMCAGQWVSTLALYMYGLPVYHILWSGVGLSDHLYHSITIQNFSDIPNYNWKLPTLLYQELQYS